MSCVEIGLSVVADEPHRPLAVLGVTAACVENVG